MELIIIEAIGFAMTNAAIFKTLGEFFTLGWSLYLHLGGPYIKSTLSKQKQYIMLMITLFVQKEILCGKLLRMQKTDAKSANTWYKNNQMQAMPQNSIICTLARTQTQIFNLKI